VISNTLEPLVGLQTKNPIASTDGPPCADGPPWLCGTVQLGPPLTAAGSELVSHATGHGWPVLSKKLTAVG
jgi:hypothetical protein